MPDVAVFDHLLVAAMLVVDPLVGAWAYRRLVARVRAGDAEAKAGAYRMTLSIQWTQTIALVAIWWALSRPASALGLALPIGGKLAAGAIITALAMGFLYYQWRAVVTLEATKLDQLRAQMSAFANLLPRTDREVSLWRGVSLTAGICEEIWYRGFLIWYLTAFFGEWPAVLIGAAMFGLVHLYQGAAGMVKTGITGLLMGIVYVTTDSLLWPVILHVALDLHGGAVARYVARLTPSSHPEQAAPIR